MKKAITHLKKSDPILAAIIEKVGTCRIDYREAGFSTMARAIVFQQLNGKAATAIYERTVAALGNGGMSPRAVLRARTARLRAAGLSLQKIEYLRDLAGHTTRRTLRFDRLPDLPDGEVIETLTRVKGIGVWSAHMFLLFALRRPDILATGDYGVRAAIQRAYGLKELPRPAEVERIAEPWRPYRSFACWYLWRSLEFQKK